MKNEVILITGQRGSGKTTYLKEQIDYFCNAHMIPRDFDEIVKRGRHQALQLIVATRRPHEIPPIIRSQISRLVTFRHLEPRDLQYLREISGVEEDRIQTLENYHYIEWRLGKIIEGTVSKQKHKKGIFEGPDHESTIQMDSATE